jgi:hypothetical protein
VCGVKLSKRRSVRGKAVTEKEWGDKAVTEKECVEAKLLRRRSVWGKAVTEEE